MFIRMTRFLTLAALCALALGAADYVVGPDGALLPDPAVTPGVIRTSDAKEICAKSFRTKPFRLTTQAMKKAACMAYGVTPCPHARTEELDHLVPLEIGGMDDIRNLWPQPAKPTPGFHQKDALENFLRAEVCGGRMDLAEAQRQIMTDWYAAWLNMPAEKRK